MTPRIPGPRPGGDHNLLDLFLPQLQGFVENLPILGDLVEAITGREDGDPNDIGSMINKLKSWVGGLFGFRASISSQVSELQALISTGAQFYDSFDRGENTGALGNGWTQGGEGQPLGIRDQAAMVIEGGVTATPGRRWAKSPQAATGDTFTVSMVVHPIAPSQYAETWLFARMNAAFTEGLAVRMVSGKAWLSRVSRPSGTSNAWSTTDITPMSAKSYTKSAKVEFKGEESVLQVSIDSVIVLSASDTVHAVDAAHRFNGFAVQTTTAALGFAPSYSGALASYSLKSVAALDSVVNTATTVAVAKVAPVSSAVTAASTGAAMPVNADPVVYAAQKTVADNAVTAVGQSTTTAIRLQQTEQKQNAAVQGVNKVLTFPGSSLSTTDWTAPGELSVTSGQMVVSGQAANGDYLARANYTFATDDQAVVAQLGSEVNNDIFTYLCLRAINTGASGVALRIAANSLSIGTYSISGSTVSFSAAGSIGRGQASGDSVELRAVGNNYVALVNGNAVMTHGGSLGTIGSSNRSAGVIKSRGQSGIFTVYSFNLRSFGMYDFGTVGASVTSRTAARLSRASTATVNITIGNGGLATVPDNFYSTTDYAQGMTVTDITTGSIRVDTAGWYEITASHGAVYEGGDANYWGQAFWCLYVNGTAVTGAIPTGVPLKHALFANDVVRAGIVSTQSSVSVRGASDSRYGATLPVSLVQIGGGQRAFFQIVANN